MKSLVLIVISLALSAVVATMVSRRFAPGVASAGERGAPRATAAPPDYAPSIRREPEVVEGAALVVEAPSPEPRSGASPFVGSTRGVTVVEPTRDDLAGFGPSPAPHLDPRPFSEAHWQGLELIPKTPSLGKTLRLPDELSGVVLDDVSLPADLQGFVAGDLIVAVDGVPTPDLLSFVRGTERVRDRRDVEIEIWRPGGRRQLVLSALFDRLGTANGETPPMILPGARSPHQYQGACTSCHRVGNDGTLATDQGDPTGNSPPPLSGSSTPAPHRARGPCSSCHRILP